MATVFNSPAELEAAVGKNLGASDWLEITQERIDLFAEATGDFQWIHVDRERARRESPFGTTIAHGHLTLSLAPKFLAEIIEVKSARLLVNPGVERMRLRSPVRCGDRVRMRATLEKLRELRGAAIHVTLQVAFEVQGQDRPAAFGKAMVVYFP